jgi:hypothetical protein
MTVRTVDADRPLNVATVSEKPVATTQIIKFLQKTGNCLKATEHNRAPVLVECQEVTGIRKTLSQYHITDIASII